MIVVDIPLMIASKFFSRELPRRGIFQEMEGSGLQVIDYGCQVRCMTDQDGNDFQGYHKYYIAFGCDAQAVQFKLTYLC